MTPQSIITRLYTSRAHLLARLHAFILMSLVFMCLPAIASAGGTIIGYVRDARYGTALSNARVVMGALERQTVTGEDGAFVFSEVPSGSVEVSITYLGMRSQRLTIEVADGQVAYRDIQMSRVGESEESEEVIKLEKLTVVADREASARDMALNDQLMSPNTKNVVSLDEYGNRKGSIGEFLSFLPGVSIDYRGVLNSFSGLDPA